MAKSASSPLTDVQREIMEIVWQLGEVSVSDIHSRISLQRDVARNTVQTLVVRLEEKGWLQHTEEGRRFLYSAAKPRTKSLGARVSQLIDSLFGGSPEQMVNALIDYRGLTESELQNIRQMIDQAEQAESDELQPTKPRSHRKGRKS